MLSTTKQNFVFYLRFRGLEWACKHRHLGIFEFLTHLSIRKNSKFKTCVKNHKNEKQMNEKSIKNYMFWMIFDSFLILKKIRVREFLVNNDALENNIQNNKFNFDTKIMKNKDFWMKIQCFWIKNLQMFWFWYYRMWKFKIYGSHIWDLAIQVLTIPESRNCQNLDCQISDLRSIDFEFSNLVIKIKTFVNFRSKNIEIWVQKNAFIQFCMIS